MQVHQVFFPSPKRESNVACECVRRTTTTTRHPTRPPARSSAPAYCNISYQTAKMKTSALLCAFVASASAFAPQQQVAARAPALNGVPLANGKFYLCIALLIPFVFLLPFLFTPLLRNSFLTYQQLHDNFHSFRCHGVRPRLP